MRSLIALVLALVAMAHVEAQVTTHAMPNVTVGRVERLSQFSSRYVQARDIDVWLPPDYSADRRY